MKTIEIHLDDTTLTKEQMRSIREEYSPLNMSQNKLANMRLAGQPLDE